MMCIQLPQLFALAILAAIAVPSFSQQAVPGTAKPEDTEVWQPEPKVVTPGAQCGAPPSDAIILFDGKNLDEWVSAQDRSAPAKWVVANGVLTVDKSAGNIETKRTFRNYQFHMEWKVPENITGTGQLRGNSGLFLASTGPGDAGYELQVLDSYRNKTFVPGNMFVVVVGDRQKIETGLQALPLGKIQLTSFDGTPAPDTAKPASPGASQ